MFPISNWTELDVWEYIAARGPRAAVDLLRPRARRVRPRRDALRASPTSSTLLDGEAPERASVRYRTVGDMSCTGAVRSAAGDARGRRGRDRRHADHRARRDARRRPRVARPRWRTASARATSSHGRAPPPRHRRLGRRRQVHADRPAALRRQGRARRPARARRAGVRQARHARSTSRCSPTACAPSASRASRSTSPTARSRPPAAASSSPTRPATRSTRATWSPARRPPTSR